MLECSDFKVYVQGASTHLDAGLSIPSTGAVRRSPVASIFSLVVFGGLYRGSTERRSRAGNANSIQSAVLISINGGSSLNLREDTIMDDVRNATRLFSQLSPEKQFICLSILKNPKLLEILDKLPRDHVAVISEHMRGLLFGGSSHV